MVWFLLECKQIGDKYSADEMSVYAAQASFFIILAAFPFLMLLLSLIQLIPVISESDLLTFVVQMVPDTLDALVVSIIDSLYSDSPMTILSATAITALWSASRGMLSIERGLNRIHGVPRRRGYLLSRTVCSGYTVVFSVMCVLCLVFLVFGENIRRQLLRLFPALTRFRYLLSLSGSLLPLVILFFFFLTLYSLLPHKRQTLKSQLPGAVFSSVGWSVFSVGFSFYFRNFSNYAVMYGSLTAVILLMLWLYFCICILFLGAEINWYYGQREKKYGHSS